MRRYIADLHFYHENLLENMDFRPFSNVTEMNEYIISQWNSVVKKKDEVVILGDLSFGKGKETNEILNKLNGKLYLIVGNHDHRFLGDKEFDSSRFVWIRDYAELNENHRKVVLSHYPIFCYNGQYKKDKNDNPTTFMLHGHVHNSHDYELIKRFEQITKETKVVSKYVTEPTAIPCQMINCFCMFSDYKPLSLDEWIELSKSQ